MKFTVDQKTKRPKPPCESNSAFALYAYRRMKLETGHLVHEPVNIKVDLPKNIKETQVISLSFENRGIKITEYRTAQKTQLEFFNTNYNKTVTIRAKEPVANFMTFNKGTENFDEKYKKFDDVGIIAREFKKRFAVNRTEDI